MRLFLLPAVLSLLTITSTSPVGDRAPKPLPLLVWHGLGDRYDAEGLQSVGTVAERTNPGTFVYYIRLDDDGSQDRTASFFGNVTTQIEQVCEDIKRDPRLRLDGERVRVDALGFSQGGQFLRGLLQRCEGLSVRSLVTFGSQHNGIAEFQACGAYDWVCKGAAAIMRGNAWTAYAQSRVVPAQYYRTINATNGLASADYLTRSNFLADINNERPCKNPAYASALASLDHFVMYVFGDDTTVIPKESGWFAEVNATSGDVTPLHDRALYAEDWLGLKRLDARGGLVFRTTPGRHMELSDELLVDTFTEFFGPDTQEKQREERKKLDNVHARPWSAPWPWSRPWGWPWERWQKASDAL